MSREPSLQDPLPFPSPHASVRRGDLRRQRRSHQTQTYAGALPARLRRPSGARLRRRRNLAHRDDRRRVPREDARIGGEVSRGLSLRRGVWRSFAQGLFYMAGDIADAESVQAPGGLPGRGRNRHGKPPATSLFYLSTQPSHYAPIAEGSARRDLQQGRRLAAHHHRKALRPRSRERTRAERAAARVFDESDDLSHRSLSRQGDRPEHPGVPLRQRHLRAALEPALRRITCRSPPPNRSAWKGAAPITRKPARCAT